MMMKKLLAVAILAVATLGAVRIAEADAVALKMDSVSDWVFYANPNGTDTEIFNPKPNADPLQYWVDIEDAPTGGYFEGSFTMMDGSGYSDFEMLLRIAITGPLLNDSIEESILVFDSENEPVTLGFLDPSQKNAWVIDLSDLEAGDYTIQVHIEDPSTGGNSFNNYQVKTEFIGTSETNVTPEPATLAILGLGLVGGVIARRRMKK